MSKKNDYELIDSGNQMKLERFGSFILARPAAAAVWNRRSDDLWVDVHAVFDRDRRGTGRWKEVRSLPQSWTMSFEGVVWDIRPNEHGNVGIFPEQAPCWTWIQQSVKARRAVGPCEVLNLFGYTGGSTMAAVRGGGKVVHLDASKTSVESARENATRSGLGSKSVRWMTDDAIKFLRRELRRDRRYHGIILDPPTYGRGTGGEVWKIEEGIGELMSLCRKLLADDAALMLFTSHSPGFTPLALQNLLEAPRGSEVESGEMVIDDSLGRPLPSGAFARWRRG